MTKYELLNTRNHVANIEKILAVDFSELIHAGEFIPDDKKSNMTPEERNRLRNAENQYNATREQFDNAVAEFVAACKDYDNDSNNDFEKSIAEFLAEYLADTEFDDFHYYRTSDDNNNADIEQFKRFEVYSLLDDDTIKNCLRQTVQDMYDTDPESPEFFKGLQLLTQAEDGGLDRCAICGAVLSEGYCVTGEYGHICEDCRDKNTPRKNGKNCTTTVMMITTTPKMSIATPTRNTSTDTLTGTKQ